MGDWRADGLCAQTDPEAFFPEPGGSTRNAKRVCNGNTARDIEPCPVREQCLQYALETDQRWGVWGGMSERERRAMAASSDGAGGLSVVENREAA